MRAPVGQQPAGVVADLPPVHGLGAGGGERMKRRRAEPQVPIQVRRNRGRFFQGKGRPGRQLDVDRLQLADRAVADQFRHAVVVDHRAVLDAHLEHRLVASDRLDERASLGDGQRRLLAEHVLARLQGHQRDRHVPVVGRGDDHGVDVLAGDEVAEIGDLLAARGRVLLVDRFAGPRAAAGHHVADGDRPGVVLDQERLQVMSITFVAQPDEAQRDLFRGGRVAEEPRGQDQRRGRRAGDACHAADCPAAGDCGLGLSLGNEGSSMRTWFHRGVG